MHIQTYTVNNFIYNLRLKIKTNKTKQLNKVSLFLVFSEKLITLELNNKLKF